MRTETEFEFYSKNLQESVLFTLYGDVRSIEAFKEGLEQEGVASERMVTD
jgi:hypothetical protein